MKELQPHQQRVVDELSDLKDKLSKLAVFINSEQFAQIVTDENEQNRLKRQFEVMSEYAGILDQRIACF